MRFVISLVTLAFAVCSTIPVSKGQSQAASPSPGPASAEPKPSTDSPMEFLLRSAATDFHVHRPPDVERFRHVRFGHVMTPAEQSSTRYAVNSCPSDEKARPSGCLSLRSRRPALNNTLEFKLRAGANVHNSYRIRTKICQQR